MQQILNERSGWKENQIDERIDIQNDLLGR